MGALVPSRDYRRGFLVGAGCADRFDVGVSYPRREAVREIDIDDAGSHQRVGPFFGAVRDFSIRLKMTDYRAVIARTEKTLIISQ